MTLKTVFTHDLLNGYIRNVSPDAKYSNPLASYSAIPSRVKLQLKSNKDYTRFLISFFKLSVDPDSTSEVLLAETEVDTTTSSLSSEVQDGSTQSFMSLVYTLLSTNENGSARYVTAHHTTGLYTVSVSPRTDLGLCTFILTQIKEPSDEKRIVIPTYYIHKQRGTPDQNRLSIDTRRSETLFGADHAWLTTEGVTLMKNSIAYFHSFRHLIRAEDLCALVGNDNWYHAEILKDIILTGGTLRLKPYGEDNDALVLNLESIPLEGKYTKRNTLYYLVNDLEEVAFPIVDTFAVGTLLSECQLALNGLNVTELTNLAHGKLLKMVATHNSGANNPTLNYHLISTLKNIRDLGTYIEALK